MVPSAAELKWQVRCSGEEPLVFAGSPTALRGRLPLVNGTQDKVVVRSITAKIDKAVKGAARSAVSYRATSPSRLKVRPGEESQQDISFDFGPHLPPGHYSGQVSLNDQDYPAKFLVARRDDVDVEPKRLVVVAEAGELSRGHWITITNHGNTEVCQPSTLDVVLEDQFFNCRTLRQTAESLAGSEQTLDKVVMAYVNEAGEVLQSIGRMPVTHDPIVLSPGGAMAVELCFAVPNGLPTTTRFRGRVLLLDKTVQVVLCLAWPGTKRQTTKKKAVQRARKTGNRSRNK